MRKRLPVFFLTLAVLGGMLLASSGDSRKARAATASPQTAKGVILSMRRPPPKMCVGEEALVSAGALTLVPARGTHITATASGGTLTKMDWRLPDGWVGGKILITTFKATEAGKGSITFRMEEGGTNPLTYGFKILECAYEIQFSAIETVFADDVSYQITIEGDGLIDAQDMIYGEGTYSFSLLVNITMPKEGTQCTTTIPSTGKSTFSVKGSQTDTGLNISLEFRPVNLGGGKVKCVDENGRETDFPPVFEGNVNPDEAMSLTNVNVAPYQPYKWSFGKNGRGFLTIIPRRKS